MIRAGNDLASAKFEAECLVAVVTGIKLRTINQPAGVMDFGSLAHRRFVAIANNLVFDFKS